MHAHSTFQASSSDTNCFGCASMASNPICICDSQARLCPTLSPSTLTRAPPVTGTTTAPPPPSITRPTMPVPTPRPTSIGTNPAITSSTSVGGGDSSSTTTELAPNATDESGVFVPSTSESPPIDWAMVGGIIGGAVALVLIVIAVVLLLLRRRRRVNSDETVVPNNLYATSMSTYTQPPPPQYSPAPMPMPTYDDVSDVRSTGPVVY